MKTILKITFIILIGIIKSYSQLHLNANSSIAFHGTNLILDSFTIEKNCKVEILKNSCITTTTLKSKSRITGDYTSYISYFNLNVIGFSGVSISRVKCYSKKLKDKFKIYNSIGQYLGKSFDSEFKYIRDSLPKHQMLLLVYSKNKTKKILIK